MPSEPSFPTGGASKTDKQAIGVPNDYRAPGGGLTVIVDGHPQTVTGLPGVKGNVGQKPIYYDGDEYAPSRWAPEDIAQLQTALVRAGILDPTDMNPGTWDSASRKAYRELLAQSNGAGSIWEAQLQSILDNGGGKIKGGRSLPPVKVTNPVDLRAVFNKAGSDLIGHSLQPQELDQMVATYQDYERQAQTSYNTMALQGDSGTVTSPPDPQAWATEQLKTKYPAEYQGTQIGKNGDEFLQLLQSTQPGGIR